MIQWKCIKCIFKDWGRSQGSKVTYIVSNLFTALDNNIRSERKPLVQGMSLRYPFLSFVSVQIGNDTGLSLILSIVSLFLWCPVSSEAHYRRFNSTDECRCFHTHGESEAARWVVSLLLSRHNSQSLHVYICQHIYYCLDDNRSHRKLIHALCLWMHACVRVCVCACVCVRVCVCVLSEQKVEHPVSYISRCIHLYNLTQLKQIADLWWNKSKGGYEQTFV